jgi:hypothetical protein
VLNPFYTRFLLKPEEKVSLFAPPAARKKAHSGRRIKPDFREEFFRFPLQFRINLLPVRDLFLPSQPPLVYNSIQI